MGILAGLFGRKRQVDTKVIKGLAISDGPHGVVVFIKCNKCGEKIRLRLRKTSEIVHGEGTKDYEYFVQKVVMGNDCFNKMETRVEFNKAYQVVNWEIAHNAGKLITKSEFDSEE